MPVTEVPKFLRGALRLPCAAVLASALWSAPGAARADDGLLPESLRVHGFATLGLAHTTMDGPWRMRRDVLQQSTGADWQPLIDSRAGLQANWQIAPEWEAVGQVVAKRLADDAPLADHVEWAFLSYKPTPTVTLRLGRTSPDLFLLSDYRNVGFAYPWVRPSTEFYGWIPTNSIDGIDAARDWQDGAGATWRVKGFFGKGRSTAPLEPDDHIELHTEQAFGLTLSREQDGLQVKLSYSRLRVDLSGSTQLAAINSGLDAMQALPLPPAMHAEAAALQSMLPVGRSDNQYMAVGLAYDRGPWLVHAEASRVLSDVASQEGDHAYLSVGYRVNDFTFFGMLSRARARGPVVENPTWAPTLAPVLGPLPALALQAAGDGAAMSNNGNRADQRTTSLGARWDVHPQAALKLQWDHTKIHANGGGLWARSGTEARSANGLAVTLDVVY